MTHASEVARTELLAEFEPEFASSGLNVGKELFAVLDLFDDNPSLRRAVSDPAREPQAKAELVRKILSGKVSEPALKVVEALARRRFSTDRDFTDTLEQLGATAVIVYAEEHDGGASALDQLEDSLFAFQDIVGDSHEVQGAFSQPQAQAEAKAALALKLVPSAGEEAQVLIARAAAHPRGLKVAALVKEFQELVAKRQKRYIAEVSVAHKLSDAQLARLEAGLNKVYGRELNLNIRVFPELVGGIRVQVGDEVVDASVLSRLNELHRQLAS